MRNKLRLIYKIETIVCIAMLATTPIRPLLFKNINSGSRFM